MDLLEKMKRYEEQGMCEGSPRDLMGDALEEIERLLGLLRDKDYIRTLADYQRGHLSYYGQLKTRDGGIHA